MRLSRAATQALAAEYALGTLRGRARQRFERWMRSDAAIAAEAQGWEEALAVLAQDARPVEPPTRVWTQIEARIAPRAPDPARRAFGWRAFGITAAGLASALLAFFAWFATVPQTEPVFVAVLSEHQGGPRMVVSMHAPDELRVRVVKPWRDVAGKSLELWALPSEGAPRSLGLVANGGDTTIRIVASDARVQDVAKLAVSLEPQGGSPTRQPTGPVLCAGEVAAVRRT